MFPRWIAVIAVVVPWVVGTACKTAPVPVPAAPPPPPLRVEEDSLSKQRQKLRVSPLELVFSGVPGEAAAGEEGVAVKNVSNDAQQIRLVRVVGDDAAHFSLTGLPSLPRYLAPGKQVDFSVVFAPAASARVGVLRATLQILIGDGEEMGPLVDVSALVLQSRDGAHEPSLAEITEALGYKINVGAGAERTLGTGADPRGDEVTAALFQSTRPGNIALDPVARFSTDGPLPYGFYRAADRSENKLGALAAGEHQKLNPGFEGGEGQISFDPGPEPFGLFVTTAARTAFSDNARNQESATAGKVAPAAQPGKRRGKKPPPAAVTVPHAVRVFPLKSRNGTPIANAYLCAFEESDDGDYQDQVFVLWNVRLVNPAPAANP